MLPRNHSDCIQIAFDDCRLVANTGDKIMTLVASALAGGDCIDDADALRTGGAACTLAPRSRRHPPWAPSCAASGGATSVNWTG